MGNRTQMFCNFVHSFSKRLFCLQSSQVTEGVESEHKSADLVVDTDVTPYRKEQRKCIICRHNIKLDYKVRLAPSRKS